MHVEHPSAREEDTASLRDEALVERIAEGDRAAFAVLYDRYASMLLAVASRMLRSEAEAEDLTHDICLEVYRQAHTYDGARGTVRAWLLMRLRSRALDRLKSAGNARRSEPTAVEELEDVAPQGGVDPTLYLDCVRVRRALEGLMQDQRAVLELAYFDGLSLQEIGERLMIPVGTVKSRLSRALEKLRAELQ